LRSPSACANQSRTERRSPSPSRQTFNPRHTRLARPQPIPSRSPASVLAVTVAG
jgi:hypothetical protein